MQVLGWNTVYRIDNVFDWLLVDNSRKSWGESDDYLEIYDIAWIKGHGDVHGDYFWFYRNRYGHLSCNTKPNIEMYLGELFTEIKWLILHSCHSLDEYHDAWKNTWRPAFHGLHQVFGYHGLAFTSESVWLRENYRAFAEDAYTTSIAISWKFNAYELDHKDYEGEEDVDICPVVYTGRDTLNDADLILDNEKFPTPGHVNIMFPKCYSPSKWRRRYHAGCNPADGGPM